jgi:hypothetical protein
MRLKESNVIAVDLDATLADDSVISMEDYKPYLIGDPVPLMVDRVKEWLRQGKEVVILTARVHPTHGLAENALTEKAIKEWCVKHIGKELLVTCEKSPMFCEIWDDKAVRIVKNRGIISSQVDVEDPLDSCHADQIGEFFE